MALKIFNFGKKKASPDSDELARNSGFSDFGDAITRILGLPPQNTVAEATNDLPVAKTKVNPFENLSFNTLQRYLTIALLVSLLLLLLFVYLNGREKNIESSRIEVAGDSLMHSQRLAKAAPVALQGSATAFKQLKDSKDRLATNLNALLNGSDEKDLPSASSETTDKLNKIIADWKKTEKSAADILSQEKTLTDIGNTMQVFNASNPQLLEQAEQVAALKLQNNSNSNEVAASSQLVMLTQRLGKNMNEFLSGAGVNPETAFLLGKDTNTFNDTLNGLLNGSDALRLTATKDAETKQKLTELAQSFDGVQKSTSSLLENLPGLIAAKRAQQQIFSDNEALRNELSELQVSYTHDLSSFTWQSIGLMFTALSTLACLAALTFLYLRDSRARAAEAETRQREAEEFRLVEKRNNDTTQAAILRLMNELQDIADGDLSKQTTVSEDITGAIADSVNYTVEELRNLVGRVQGTATEVAHASSEVEQTSTRLVGASAEQSQQIKSTGETIVQMASRMNDVSSGAAESAKVARASLAAAETGQKAVQDAIAGMGEIRQQIQETSKRIKRLGESSQEIGEIVELISDITEQTNVLALNAAIQAASAGEAGRGFTVVAEEVQRLAERSGDATKQIGALIRTIQTDTQDAVSAMEKSTQGVVEGAKLSDNAGAALSEIEQVSRRLSELIEGISKNTSQEAGVANEAAKNIQKILAITEQTSAGTQQTAESVRQLTELSDALRNSVSRFRIA